MRVDHKSDYSNVSAQPFELSESPFMERKSSDEMIQDMSNFIESRFGVVNRHAMVSGMRGQSAIVISAVSQKADAVVEGIYNKHLRDAAAQLTGSRVGGVFLFFPDLKEGELHEVAGGETGLTNAVQVILQKRPRLYGVTLMASGTVTERKSDLIIAPTITSESGPVYTFRNPFYSLGAPADDIFRKIFRSAD